MTTNACYSCRQAHKKCSFAVKPFQPCGQKSSRPRCPCEDSFVVDNDESIPEQEWTLKPQAGRQERFQIISCVPSKRNPPNPPQKDTPVPCMPCKQTPGPSGTQWSRTCSATPIQSSKLQVPSHEDTSTFEHEPEVAQTQSMEEPFGKSPLYFFYSYKLSLTRPDTPHSIIIIDNSPVTPPPPSSLEIPTASSPLAQSSPHSHNEAQQEFTNLLPTLIIPQEIVHYSINQILLEHCQFLHMIPFVDATH
ncbi:hypothetical protein O181_014761 [Austropuccinia psidii MF-1]|uniref:Zn(2)-C6 fungal-type domain-containing protein n=1 Tax=Austropuccinia psidii MF-1 TaxID=1389203 RepID=A0A9Q3GPF4_9BASI|nr:hypothetical protein [Austropuccinia psidii MF-1]